MINFVMQCRVDADEPGQFQKRFDAAIQTLAAERQAPIRLWQSVDDASCLMITNESDDESAFRSFLQDQGLLDTDRGADTVCLPRISQLPLASKVSSNPKSVLVNLVEPYYFEQDAA